MINSTGPRTNNYRIRKLADGRIGQHREEQLVHPKPVEREDPEASGSMNVDADGHGDTGIGANNDTPSHDTSAKPKRKSVPDTWAVRILVSVAGIDC